MQFGFHILFNFKNQECSSSCYIWACVTNHITWPPTFETLNTTLKRVIIHTNKQIMDLLDCRTDFVLQVYGIDIADERCGSKSVPSRGCFVLIPFSDKVQSNSSQE